MASATNGTITSPTDTVTVPATQSPALTLKKSANPLTYTTVGQTITYDYLLTNSGNVTLGSPFAVTDDKATVTCPAAVTSLAPGATLNCTATYIITQADLDSGSVINIATATAKFGDDHGHIQPGHGHRQRRPEPGTVAGQDRQPVDLRCGRPDDQLQLPGDQHRQRDPQRAVHSQPTTRPR